MKTQQQMIISEVTQCNKLLKTSANGGYVPIDLLIDIFSRLPAKSIARCRCVSKPWDSLLRFPSFTELFLTRSLARPQLLFACYKFSNEVSFFSSTQPRILDENLSVLTASYQMKILYNFKFERFSPIRGLVFLENKRSVGRVRIESVICNPSTGQSWTLPKVNSRRRTGVRSYFGYDPVEKQYKVLSMTWKISTYRDFVCEEHQVMTLGSREPSWRMIECPIPHCSTTIMNNQICINGVLYYTAFEWVESRDGNLIIICFDVKSEKFSFIKHMETTSTELGVTPLINCNGTILGSLSYDLHYVVTTGYHDIILWVLEDAEKQEWLKHTYVLPALWNNRKLYLRFVGVTQTKEIVLSTYSQNMPYYIFFYNTEKETMTRSVEIQGMETFKPWDIYTYLDHIEDVKLMQM